MGRGDRIGITRARGVGDVRWQAADGDETGEIEWLQRLTRNTLRRASFAS